MDPAGVSICQQNSIPFVVFDFAKDGSIERIVKGEKVGTLVGANLQTEFETKEKVETKK